MKYKFNKNKKFFLEKKEYLFRSQLFHKFKSVKKEGGLRTKKKFKKSYFNRPLISIITVVKNGSKNIRRCVESVQNQKNINVEHIIIDGDSRDNTLKIIKKYSNKIDYWISERDKGIYDAWNKAVQISCGKWIGFLGADDFYEIQAIQKYVENINLITEVEFISSQSYFCTKDKKIIRKIGKPWNWKDFSIYMNVTHPGSLHHKSLYEKYGIYDINFKVCGDYDFLLRAGNKLKAGFVNQILCNMRIGGISHGGTSKIFEEIYQAKLKNNTRPTYLHIYIDTLWARLKWEIRKYF